MSQARHVISNALAEYCTAVDLRDAGRVAGLLARTRLVFRDQAVAPADVQAFYDTAFASGTQHVVTNLHVTAGTLDNDGPIPPSAPVGTADAMFIYTASYQRWELDHGAPRCAALGRYDGTFYRPDIESSVPASDAPWVWSTHRVITHAHPHNAPPKETTS